MKAKEHLRKLLSILILFLFAPNLFSQTGMLTVKHTINPADKSEGRFEVTSSDGQSPRKITVKEMSVSVSVVSEKKIYASADMVEISEGKSPKNISAVVKSYADPDFTRSETEEKQSSEDTYKENSDESLPKKMYLSVVTDDSETTYDFYDITDLESIVNDLNSSYDANLEVVGSGRNVYVRKSKIKKETDFSAGKVFNTESLLSAGLDINKLEAEILKDKILKKNQITSYTVVLEKEQMYINGNQVSDKLALKYRKIFDNFNFEFSDE